MKISNNIKDVKDTLIGGECGKLLKITLRLCCCLVELSHGVTNSFLTRVYSVFSLTLQNGQQR